MGLFVKLFGTHSQYESYTAETANFILPNVSYCIDTPNEVHYNPSEPPTPVETRLIAIFNVTEPRWTTQIVGTDFNESMTTAFTSIEIDGVEQQSIVAETALTVGEHTVKYTLADPTTIGDYALNRCNGSNGVTSVTIPNSVTSIGDYAFRECDGMSSITINNTITSIGDGSFMYCSSLTSVTIPSSVTSIGDGAFNFCSELTSVTIPNSVASIGERAFGGCNSMTSITIPNSVTSIGDYAFDGCTVLTGITIPNSVTSIGEYVLSYCNTLTNIAVDSSNTIYDSRNNCNAIIETTTNKLIQGCSTTVIPNDVTSIDNGAFYGHYSLTSITIPSSVTSIGDEAFYECDELTSVTINATTPPTLGDDAFYDTNNCTIYVPSGSVEAYKSTSGWSSLASRIQAIP